jgi:hypothetical protein
MARDSLPVARGTGPLKCAARGAERFHGLDLGLRPPPGILDIEGAAHRIVEANRMHASSRKLTRVSPLAVGHDPLGLVVCRIEGLAVG